MRHPQASILIWIMQYHKKSPKWTHDAITTSLLRQNDVVGRNNDVIIVSCVMCPLGQDWDKIPNENRGVVQT